jgi:hypothetical protein
MHNLSYRISIKVSNHAKLSPLLPNLSRPRFARGVRAHSALTLASRPRLITHPSLECRGKACAPQVRFDMHDKLKKQKRAGNAIARCLPPPLERTRVSCKDSIQVSSALVANSATVNRKTEQVPAFTQRNNRVQKP